IRDAQARRDCLGALALMGDGKLRIATCNFCVVLGLLLVPASARAQTSYPMLTSVYPAGLQRGTTAELTVTGTNNFAGAYEVLFEGKGLSAAIEATPGPDPKAPAPGKKPAR